MVHVLAILPAIFYLVYTDPALSSSEYVLSASTILISKFYFINFFSLMVQSWQASLVVAFSCGYFVWDILEVSYHLEYNGVAFLIHAIYCLGVYAIAVFVPNFIHSYLHFIYPGSYSTHRASSCCATRCCTSYLRSPRFL